MPGAKWGEKRDRTFPENAFNPTWAPFLPAVGPAFAEIAVTWESEYSFACLEELVKRVGSHLQRLGAPKIDVEAAKAKLAKLEDEDVKKARTAEPSDVTLDWEGDVKTFDVFLR